MGRLAPGTYATYWFGAATFISIVLVGATAVHVLGTQSGVTGWLLFKLTLTTENNPGAWWSGMLLALLSLHAFDGHVLLRRSDPNAAKGWMLLAAVLLFFSLDEIGSIHERLGVLGRALSLGSWTLLLPVGALLAVVFLRAVLLLSRAQGERRKLAWIIIGFGTLGSAALQEYLEHRMVWQIGVARAIRASVEEGTELLGMLILLRVFLWNTVEIARRSSGAAAFAALQELRIPLLAIGLALTPVMALGTAALSDQQRGHPADWLAATAFLGAGLVFAKSFWTDDKAGPRWAGWIVGGLCCLASVAVEAISPTKLVELGPLGVSVRMVFLVMTFLLVGAALACLPEGRGRRYAGGAVVVGALAAALLRFTNTALVYGLCQLLGLLMFWFTSAFAEEIATAASAMTGITEVTPTPPPSSSPPR